jgi:hypothetical protein
VAARGGRCDVMENCAELLTSYEATIYIHVLKHANLRLVASVCGSSLDMTDTAT